MAEVKNATKADEAMSETADQIREFNERAIEASKKAGASYLNAYAEALKSMCEQQEKLADSAPVEWMRSVIEAQTEYTRKIADVYASAAEEAGQK